VADDIGTCGVCGARLHHSEAQTHLLTHGIDIERDAARWPDGEIVVVDQTLGPDDFDREGSDG
jgi:hypothetical protein